MSIFVILLGRRHSFPGSPPVQTQIERLTAKAMERICGGDEGATDPVIAVGRLTLPDFTLFLFRNDSFSIFWLRQPTLWVTIEKSRAFGQGDRCAWARASRDGQTNSICGGR
jgi:hypothetical protein